MNRLRAFIADWVLANYLRRRCTRRTGEWLIERRSDGTLWAAGHSQNLAYAMRALFVAGSCDWHFYRVRVWKGLVIASRRVFWMPQQGTDFRLRHRGTIFELPAWPEPVECHKIDAVIARRRLKAAA